MRNVLKVTWLERRHVLSISRALAIMLSLIVAVCYVMQSFAVTAVEGYAKKIDSHSNISVIEINTLRPNAKILDQGSLSTIKNLEHVVSVIPWIQHDLDLAEEGDWPSKDENPGSLWATTYFEPRLPKLVKGERKFHLDEGEIVLPEKVLGGDLTHLYGKTVQFGFSHVDGKFQGSYRTLELKVVGLYDNSVPDKDGEAASYISLPTMKSLFEGSLPNSYSFAYVQVDSAQNSAEVQKKLAELGFSVTGAAGTEDAVGLVGTLARVGKFILPAILVCALVFGLFLSAIWVRQRKQDFALFRALGYAPRDLGYLALLQALVVNIISSLVGVGFGALGVFILANLIFRQDSPIYGMLHIALFDPLVAIQVIGVSALGTVGGILPFVVYISRSSPDRLLRS